MKKQTVAQDGTTLDYQVEGDRGPWLVLANGLGANQSVWDDVCSYLGKSFRVIRWDYRGLYGQDNSKASSPTTVVEVLAHDMLSIVRAEHAEDAIWIGWSLGTQVLVEALRHSSEAPSALVLINPCYGHRVSRRSWLRGAMPLVLDGLRLAEPMLSPLTKRIARWPETPSWIKRLGLVARGAELERVGEVTRQLDHVQWDRYLDMLDAVMKHRVDGTLGTISVPTLAILGDHDQVTSLAESEPQARQIPNVEVFVARGATHFSLLEFPELINLRIEKFLKEHDIF